MHFAQDAGNAIAVPVPNTFRRASSKLAELRWLLFGLSEKVLDPVALFEQFLQGEVHALA